jgi:hypothetical protein
MLRFAQHDNMIRVIRVHPWLPALLGALGDLGGECSSP